MGGTPPPGFQGGVCLRLGWIRGRLSPPGVIPGNSPAPRSTRGSRGIRMPDARAKRRRQRRQEQLEAADLEKVSGFAVKTNMVTGAAIGGVAALVLANVLWPENSYIFTPKEIAMTLGGGALGAFIMGCRKMLSNLAVGAPADGPRALRRARMQGIAGAQCWASRWPWQPSFSPTAPCRS